MTAESRKWSWWSYWQSSLPMTIAVCGALIFAIQKSFAWWIIPVAVLVGLVLCALGAMSIILMERWTDRSYASLAAEEDQVQNRLLSMSIPQAEESARKLLARVTIAPLDQSVVAQWPVEWRSTVASIGRMVVGDVSLDFTQPRAKAHQREGHCRIGHNVHEPDLYFWLERNTGQVFWWGNDSSSEGSPTYPSIWHLLLDKGMPEV